MQRCFEERRYTFSLLLLLSCILFSSTCKNASYTQHPTSFTPVDLNHAFQTYEIGPEEVDSVSYKHFDLYSVDQNDYLLIVNRKTRNIEIYSLQEKEKVFKTSFEDRLDFESNGVLSGVDFYNFDSIFISQEYEITLIDTSKILKKIPINGPKQHLQGADPDMYFFDRGERFPIHYLPELQGILMHTFCRGCGGTNKEYYEAPVEALIPLDDSKSIIYYPVPHSKRFLDDYYGFAEHIYRISVGEKSHLSFIMDPNIYHFDRRTNTLEISGGRSQYQKENISPLKRKYKDDSDEKMAHLARIPLYRDLLFDPYRKLYYRFYSDAQAIQNPDGTYNSFGDKSLVLMIFDTDFNLLQELPLGQHKYIPNKSFVAREGLYLSKSHYKYPDRSIYKLQFDILSVEK